MRTPAGRSPLALVVTLAMLVPACDEAGLGPPCASEADCAPGLVCIDGSCQEEGSADGDADVDGDADADGDDEECELACGSSCCTATERCFRERCIQDLGTCGDGEGACQGDSDCLDGVCVPFGEFRDFDDECALTLEPDRFRAVLQCEWAGPPAGDPFPASVKVCHTPLVADFGIGSGPDDPPRPSIVFATVQDFDSRIMGAGVIRVVDGATCEHLATLSDTIVEGMSTPALGDLDGDGRPEIVAAARDGGLVAWSYRGPPTGWEQLWRSADRSTTTSHALSLADLDDDGRPEIVAGGLVHDADGALVSSAIPEIIFPTPPWGHQVVTVADVDLDDELEIVLGNALWTWDHDAADLVAEPFGGGPVPLSATSLADFGDFPGAIGDAPGRPEIALATAEGFQIQTIEGEAVFGPIPIPGGNTEIDLFSIADVDGDGVPEVSVPGRRNFLTVFDLACVPGGGRGECGTGREDGILWSLPVTVETGGTSTFDFEGDGRAEVVYSDWCYLRVLDGRDGTVLWSHRRASGGWHEMPIIADVDGDFRAEIVSVNAYGSYLEAHCPAIPVDPYYQGIRCDADEDCPLPSSTCDEGLCRCTEDAECGDPEMACVAPLSGSPGSGNVCRPTWGRISGVRVYADAHDRWAGSRAIWNQHAYAVTNVDEWGVVPRGSEVLRNWEVPGLNNFRQNVQAEGHDRADAPDLTVGGLAADPCDTADQSQPITLRACNRGTLPVPPGVSISLRLDTPDGEELCAFETEDILRPGECVDLGCTWEGVPLDEPHVIHAVADDGAGTISECREDNNTASLEVRCPPAIM